VETSRFKTPSAALCGGSRDYNVSFSGFAKFAEGSESAQAGVELRPHWGIALYAFKTDNPRAPIDI